MKERLGLHSCAFEFSVRNRDLYKGVGGYSRTNADFIVFYQYLNQEDYIAYVPYGPEIEPSEENQGAFLEELSEALRPYLPKRCIALRYDLNRESHWYKQEDFDSEGNWIGLPKKEFQELQLNFGTVCHPPRKANTNILPANTVVVDLCRSEEKILCRMKSKTRYNIKLALRKGVEVRSVGIEGLPLAAMFLVLSAHRATYLYGASSSVHRNLMPTYALQWKAIQLAKQSYSKFGAKF